MAPHRPLLLALLLLAPSALHAIPARDVIGSTHAAGKYSFTTEDFLNEGPDELLRLGTRTIKVWFDLNGKSPYPFNSEWGEPAEDFAELARHPYYQELFAKPFTTFILVTSRRVASPDFLDGMSREEIEDERRMVHDLAGRPLGRAPAGGVPGFPRWREPLGDRGRAPDDLRPRGPSPEDLRGDRQDLRDPELGGGPPAAPGPPARRGAGRRPRGRRGRPGARPTRAAATRRGAGPALRRRGPAPGEEPDRVRLRGMAAWWNARQAGVTQARIDVKERGVTAAPPSEVNPLRESLGG